LPSLLILHSLNTVLNCLIHHLHSLFLIPIYRATTVPNIDYSFLRFPREKRYDIFWSHFLGVAFCYSVYHFALAILAAKLG
jgi:hypothetical protein